jgi:hypothetical protein
MPYIARFSRIFLKKQERLPSETKSRIVESIRETLIQPSNGVMLVGPLRVYGKHELENTESFTKSMKKKRQLWSTT